MAPSIMARVLAPAALAWVRRVAAAWLPGWCWGAGGKGAAAPERAAQWSPPFLQLLGVEGGGRGGGKRE
jgi:hypothetical protein